MIDDFLFESSIVEIDFSYWIFLRIILRVEYTAKFMLSLDVEERAFVSGEVIRGF